MNNYDQVSQIDWARLAAYIDGEGCITILTAKSKKWKRHHLYVNVSVHNTDPRLISWIQGIFGGKIYSMRHRNPKWSTGYSWNMACRNANAILLGCLPYFVIKREQAEIAIAFQAITSRKWGVRGAPQEVIDQQWAYKMRLTELKGKSTRASLTQPKLDSSSLIN